MRLFCDLAILDFCDLYLHTETPPKKCNKLQKLRRKSVYLHENSAEFMYQSDYRKEKWLVNLPLYAVSELVKIE